MPYKGGDLDLRCAGAGISREVPGIAERGLEPAWGQPPVAGAQPVTVDELVLACCNRAFDVAHFHGFGSVHLEHLLHALTRIEAAAAILGEVGIRADVLRRDTAMAIAADLPAGAIDGAGAPRASPALADALRRAGIEAHARRQPASLRDLLRALLGAGPESPAARLLMRAAEDPQRLEHWRDEPRREALAPAQLARTETQAATLPPVADALVQRLDQMQASMQALREEAAADRKATGDLLHTLQAELQAWRSDAAREPAGDRSEAVDAVLEAKLGEFGRAMAALAGRLGAIDKLAAGDHWQALGARLGAVEGRVAAQTTELANALTSALSQRRQEDEGRLIALEASIRSQVQAAEEAAKVRDRELREIHDALVRIGASQQMLSGNLAAWQAEGSGDIGILSNRLQRLEQSALDLLDRLNGEVQALRQEHEDEAQRGNGFKRWLYGTGSVFAASRRDEAASVRQRLDRSRSGDKS